METLILSLDVFDDLQDGDNKIAIWMKDEEEAVALNHSLGILSLSYLFLAESMLPNKNELLKIISKFLIQSIEGQYLDLKNKIDVADDYIKMCSLKSGSLIAMANLLGASIHTSKYNDLIEVYSYHIGIAAQILNDVQDIHNFDGKSDWRFHKKTLPILYLLNLSKKSPNFIKDYFNNRITYDELYANKDQVLDLINTSGALNYALAVKELHKNKAYKLMNELPIKENKKKILIEETLKYI